jgi:hypothetical protein
MGSIVARTHDMEKLFGKKVVPDLLQRMSVLDEDSFQTTTLEGKPLESPASLGPEPCNVFTLAGSVSASGRPTTSR